MTSHSFNPPPRSLWACSPLHGLLMFNVSGSDLSCPQLRVNIILLPSTTPKEVSPASSGPVLGTQWEFPGIGGSVPALVGMAPVPCGRVSG